MSLLVFSLSGQPCGLPLSCIERVVRVVEIAPLPKAPEIVMGLINFRGLPVPVLDIRKLFGMPEGEITLDTQIIIARTKKRPVALLVDYATGVAAYGAEDATASEQIFPDIGYLGGVAKLKDGIVYIYDLDRFLTLEEEAVIDGLLHPEAGLPGTGGRDK